MQNTGCYPSASDQCIGKDVQEPATSSRRNPSMAPVKSVRVAKSKSSQGVHTWYQCPNCSRMAIVLSQSMLSNPCAETMHAEAAQELAIPTERSPYMTPLRSVSELRLRDKEGMLTRFKGVTTLVPTMRALVASSRLTHTTHYSVGCLSNAANPVATDPVHLPSPPCISPPSRRLRLPSR